jgi:dTDP-4-dehydrorhamnose 3,5-epimerase
VEIIAAPLPGLLVLAPRVFADARGYFLESYRATVYAELGITGPFVQDNLSRSVRGALRGLHYQIETPQGKLVQVARGAAFDVAVDLRASSPAFGRWYGTTLSDENHHQLWIPEGFAHGFYALSDVVDVAYKVTGLYVPDHERTLLWSDPDVGIGWPAREGPPLLSAKDAGAPPLARAERFP